MQTSESIRLAPILVGGDWLASLDTLGSFSAFNPLDGQALPERYPISGERDLGRLLAAATRAGDALYECSPERIACFFERYANLIDLDRVALAQTASLETGLPYAPRLLEVELPRTINQLRLAAVAVRTRAWQRPVVDEVANIRCQREPLGGAVLIFGPNNFPFAFNAVSGGDFVAAIATHHAVIAKAHPAHPHTSMLLAELARTALIDCGLPPATVQMLYALPNRLGEQLVAHEAIAAVAFTGSRSAGLALKRASDASGTPFYGEFSSVNPVFVLPGALESRLEAMAEEFSASCLLGAGQFCTNPGLVVVLGGAAGERLITLVKDRFSSSPPLVLLTEGGRDGLERSIETLRGAGAELIAGGARAVPGFRFQPSLLRVTGEQFLEQPKALQTEAFGPVSLFVTAENESELLNVARCLEGNLTATICTSGTDALYPALERILRRKVGRLLNNKMPTGVAVSPAMNHGGPYPASSHAGFTSVGIPASFERFTKLMSYDNIPVAD